jgi:hypothetical protein
MRFILRALVEHEVPFALSTDGPEMLRSYLRDEVAYLMRHEILTFAEVTRALETATRASFVGHPEAPAGGVSGDGRDPESAAPIALEVEA